MKRLLVVVVLLALAVPCLAFRQAQTAQPPKSGPEVQKLAYYVGTWKSEGEFKAGSIFPAGKFSTTETCESFEGGFHLLCRDEGTGPAGKKTALSIVGYDADAKAYSYYRISSLGESDGAKGSFTESTWTWLSDEKVAGKPAKFRYTEVQVSPTFYTYKFENSVTGWPWTVIEEGKATKVK